MSTEIVEIKGVKFDPTTAVWVKSSRSSGNTDNCVETAFFDGGVAVRDSKNPDAAPLIFTNGEWTAFLGGVMDGEFDL